MGRFTDEGEAFVIPPNPNRPHGFQLTTLIAKPSEGPPLAPVPVEPGVTRVGFLTASMEMAELYRNVQTRRNQTPPLSDVQLVAHQPIPPGTTHRIVDAANGIVNVDVLAPDTVEVSVEPFTTSGDTLTVDPKGTLVRRTGRSTVKLQPKVGQNSFPIVNVVPGSQPPQYVTSAVYEFVFVPPQPKGVVH